MSLDVYLEDDDGEWYSANITHNLGAMAKSASIYNACWYPENIGITKASELAPLLEAGITQMKTNPKKFEKFNSSNGWGMYENFVPWLERYLEACKQYPNAKVRVSQ